MNKSNKSPVRAAIPAFRAAVHAANLFDSTLDPWAHVRTASTNAAAAFALAATEPGSSDDGNAAYNAAWKMSALDAVEIEEVRSAFHTSLWPNGDVPDWLPMVHRDWRGRGPGWDFWADWYEGYLTGRPLDFDLLEKVALIPDAECEKGDDHVNGIIARIRLDHAVEATPNGEIITVNPETGKLRIETDAALPKEIGRYARRKIAAAVDIFARVGNQYTALAADLRMLREAAEDPEFTPVELFDACASASRRLGLRIRNGEVPAADEDALIADYARRIRDAGADIRGNDPTTPAVLEARADQRYGRAAAERRCGEDGRGTSGSGDRRATRAAAARGCSGRDRSGGRSGGTAGCKRQAVVADRQGHKIGRMDRRRDQRSDHRGCRGA